MSGTFFLALLFVAFGGGAIILNLVVEALLDWLAGRNAPGGMVGAGANWDLQPTWEQA